MSCGHSFGAAPTFAGPDLPPGLSSGLATDSLAGRVIAERYVIGGLLGKGGVGAVYRARDKVVNEDIAIKVLQESPSRDPMELDRFRRELVTARKVSHPNVIRIHDMGVLGAEFFISMELLEGGSLAALLRKGVPNISRAVAIAIGICEGLHAAHLQGVVHRDIKPDNVMFDLKGVPKLMDFGLARLTTSGTRTAGFTGTPFYMSPEQADGVDPTAQSDLYSLGVLLFELFTGRLPFVSDSLVRLIVLHTKEPPPSPRSFRADLPEEIEGIILGCLEKTAARRPQSASDLASAFRRFEMRQSGALPAFVPPPKPASLSRWVFAGVGVAAIGALAFALLPGTTPDRVATPTPVESVVALATATAVASETPATTATPTATPTATRTAIAVVTTATPVPLATPVVIVGEPGSLSVTSFVRIRLDVFVDGVERGSVPVSDIALEPGTRVIQFRQNTTAIHEVTLDVKPGTAHAYVVTRDDSGIHVLKR